MVGLPEFKFRLATYTYVVDECVEAALCVLGFCMMASSLCQVAPQAYLLASVIMVVYSSLVCSGGYHDLPNFATGTSDQ